MPGLLARLRSPRALQPPPLHDANAVPVLLSVFGVTKEAAYRLAGELTPRFSVLARVLLRGLRCTRSSSACWARWATQSMKDVLASAALERHWVQLWSHWFGF
jgi:hypothetical protein